MVVAVTRKYTAPLNILIISLSAYMKSLLPAILLLLYALAGVSQKPATIQKAF